MTHIKEVLILGGGTSGWMSALYINRLLGQRGTHDARVTLVESPDVSVIGVGESTFDQIRSFMADMQISEPDFIKATDASFKHGTRFCNWLYPKSGTRAGHFDDYFHPFEFPSSGPEAVVFNHWVALHANGQAPGSLGDSVGIQYPIAKACKSPKLMGTPEYQGQMNYAYNLDAIKMGAYLRQVAKERGVNHIVDHCHDVEVTENGYITAIRTEQTGRIEADFFIDCTGFANVLMRKIGNTDFIDYTDKLLSDRAVAARVPLNEDEPWKPRPYTTSTAQESGWIWDIDLYRRRGAGYVYSSQHSTEDRAEQVLREYIGSDADFEIMHHKMRVGRLRKIWHKNCVAVGLASGFIEPLEATGILFIDLGLRYLGELFPSQAVDQTHASRYSDLMAGIMDATRDFILLHYILTRREDSEFWRAYCHDIEPTDQLAERLELWKTKIPSNTDVSFEYSLFASSSFSYVLYGMDWQHTALPGSVAHFDPKFGRQVMEAMRQRQEQILAKADDHAAVIDALRDQIN